MLNIKYQHSWLHCTSRKDIFLYITQICKTSEHSATGKSLPHLWHTAQHSIHTQHRKYRIHQEYSTQHKIYHVYQKYSRAWSLFCSWPGTGSPPPTLQKRLLAMDLLTMRFNCLPCHFQYSFHWGMFHTNFRWILDIHNTANNCYVSWVWLDLQLISNQCSELHREPRRQFIWTNGSFGPIIGWLQSLLLIALVIAKIWLSNMILQEWFATRTM